MWTVQVRSEETGTREFDSWAEAFDYAQEDPSVWKISWWDSKVTGKVSRVRLTRDQGSQDWNYEPLEVGDE